VRAVLRVKSQWVMRWHLTFHFMWLRWQKPENACHTELVLFPRVYSAAADRTRATLIPPRHNNTAQSSKTKYGTHPACNASSAVLLRVLRDHMRTCMARQPCTNQAQLTCRGPITESTINSSGHYNTV
jgi:hypothetical protein